MRLGPGLRCPQAEPSTCSLAVSSQRGGRWLSLCTRVSYLPAFMGICTADQPPPAGGEGVTCSGWQRKATRRALPSHCKIHKTGSNKEIKSHGGRELLTNQATQRSHAKNLHARERESASSPSTSPTMAVSAPCKEDPFPAHTALVDLHQPCGAWQAGSWSGQEALLPEPAQHPSL